MTPDEAEPIATIRQDDMVGCLDSASVEEQLVALMDRYETPLYAYLMTILRDRDLALDCAQETFLRAYEALKKGRAINRNWLYTVAHNRAIDEFRRRRHMDPDGERIEEVVAEERPAESRLDVQTVLDRLPSVDREVLYLFELAGFTTDEIGAMLGIRGSAVRQRLLRARHRFRALYCADPGETHKPEATYC